MGFYPFRGPDASSTRRQSYRTTPRCAKSGRSAPTRPRSAPRSPARRPARDHSRRSARRVLPARSNTTKSLSRRTRRWMDKSVGRRFERLMRDDRHRDERQRVSACEEVSSCAIFPRSAHPCKSCSRASHAHNDVERIRTSGRASKDGWLQDCTQRFLGDVVFTALRDAVLSRILSLSCC